MGVDFFPCAICGETINDCMANYRCANCEGVMDEDCYEEQKKKYSLITKKEDIEYYGKETLKECDNCSEKTKQKRIKDLEEKLEELKK